MEEDLEGEVEGVRCEMLEEEITKGLCLCNLLPVYVIHLNEL